MPSVGGWVVAEPASTVPGSFIEPGTAGFGTGPPLGALALPRTLMPVPGEEVQRAAVFTAGPSEVLRPLR